MQLEVRHHQTGEVTFRDQLARAVVDISRADLRNDGSPQVVVASADGELRGYLPADGASNSGQAAYDGRAMELVR